MSKRKKKATLDASLSRDQAVTAATRGLHQPAPKGPGRPPGKRSDPNFAGYTVYVRRDTRKAVNRALDGEKEFSNLVQELLEDWLTTQAARPKA
jgi:hypothetical protein